MTRRLAPDVEFVFDGEPTASGLDAVRDEFSDQLALSDSYDLEIDAVRSTSAGAQVQGRYSQGASGIPTAGAVTFDLVDSERGPLITRISSHVTG
ncbi:hypothetical protein BH20ACT19_BH20ACT19_10180 [soil metagenome]